MSKETTLPMNPNKNLTVSGSDLSVHELMARRRSIEQYIRILTQRTIPTRFVASDANYTTGEEIVLSSTVLDEHGYETACGVALHEATHVCITDMEYFDVKKYAEKIKYLHKSGKISPQTFDACEAIVSGTSKEESIVKFITNVVEDRRIDAWTFTRASGYKKFYMALYDSFFKTEEKAEGWTSGKYRNVNWQSYAFALVALTNDARDLTMLPDLDKIWNTISIHNIDRLKSTEEAFVVALEVFAIIKQHVDDAEENGDPESQKDDKNGEGDQQQSDSDSNNESGYSPNTGEENRKANEEFKNTTNGKENGSSIDNDSLREAIKKIMHEFARVEDAMGDDKNAVQSFKVMDEAKSDDVSISTPPEEGTSVPKCNVVIIRGFNSGIDNGMIENASYRQRKMKNAVYDGFSMGRRMARKLVFRNEQRRLVTSRQKTGKLDNSLVAEIGYSEHLFYTQQIDDYKDEFIHLSIDASGSMSGNKFERATKAAVAIAVACKDIQGVEVQITFRGATNFAGESSPFLFVAYDSRLHRINYIKKHFPSLTTCGQTPEGLTYDTIAKIAGGFDDNTNKYFINLSDGMPYFNGYSGTIARRHTKEQVTNLRRQGFNILSYFVTENNLGGNHSAKRDFKNMYGKGAEFINVESVIEIARTIMRIQRSKNKSY